MLPIGKLRLRAPASLLSLADDTLSRIFQSIFDELEDRYTMNQPISDILFCKRIFALARPIWQSRFSSRSSDLDGQLAGLLGDDGRLAHLRKLNVHIKPACLQLTKLALSRIPQLDHLKLILNDSLPLDPLKTLEPAISCIDSISNLFLIVTGKNETRWSKIYD